MKEPVYLTTLVEKKKEIENRDKDDKEREARKTKWVLQNLGFAVLAQDYQERIKPDDLYNSHYSIWSASICILHNIVYLGAGASPH